MPLAGARNCSLPASGVAGPTALMRQVVDDRLRVLPRHFIRDITLPAMLDRD
jgi:hypothetical protein